MVVNAKQSGSPRKNTSGGSAGAGGYSYQAEASASILAKILAGDELTWIETDCTRIPVEILAETGQGGDDLQVHLESGAVIEVQAKKGVQKGEKLWVALTDLALIIEKNPHTYGVLLTDSNASQTIRSDLKRDIIRFGQGRSDDLKSITKEFLKRLDKAKIKDKTNCCAKLRIVVYDFEPGSPGEESIRAVLKRILSDTTRIINAHDALSKEGWLLVNNRGRRDKRSIERLLKSKGIALFSSPFNIPPTFQETLSKLTLTVEGVQAQEKLLVLDTQKHIEKVRNAWLWRDLESVFAETPELLRWISTYGNQLPGVIVADAYALLVEVESNRLTQDAVKLTPTDAAPLEEMIRQAERALGSSESHVTCPVEQRLFSLKCFITSLVHSTDAGLAMLAGREDPYAIRRRLAILIRANRFDEALEEVSTRPLHEEWVEKAIIAFVTSGLHLEALNAIRWAKTQIALPQLAVLCAIAGADSACTGIIKFDENELWDAFESILPEHKTCLEHALIFLAEVTSALKANRQVRSELEVAALHQEAVILARLHEHEALDIVVSTLESWKPLPYVLSHLVERNLLPCGQGWPERMRNEYPDNFRVEILASIITPDVPEHRQKEFDRLCILAQLSPEHDLDIGARRVICGQLGQLAARLDEEARVRATTIENDLLKEDERAQQIMKMVRLVNDGKFDEANTILESGSDESEPAWLQCRAAIATHYGKPHEALDHLKRALAQVSYPGLLRQAAEVALEADQPVEAALLLEKYLERKPNDDGNRHQLALLYLESQEFEKATKQFETIWKRNPNDANSGLNYAASLAHSGNLAKSISVYEAICTKENPPLQAVIARSSVLKANGRPKDAFEKLIVFRDVWWEEPQYLMTVSDLGFAAQEEQTAHEALIQVQRLQAQGKADEDLIRSFSLDEAVKMFGEHRQSVDEAQGFVLRGHLPWLCVDRMFNQTAVESWHNRTRDLTWIGEMPVAQAMTAVYATNSFFIDRKADRSRAYRSLTSPQAKSHVVADLSALLTLHKLGLLNVAADFFGEILLPSAYAPVDLQDAGKLVLHQPSQKVELEALREAIDLGQILVIPRLETNQVRVTELEDSEWDEETAPYTYGLKEVLPLLLASGLITNDELLNNSHLMRHMALAEVPLVAGQRVAVNLTILKTLAGASLLEPLLNGFHVVITEYEKNTIITSLRAYKQQEELFKVHRQLWEQVRSDTRFVFVPNSRHKRAIPGEELDRRRDVEIAAALLAQERGLPLLADDRVCQTIIYSDPQSPPGCYAFGTDCLLTRWQEMSIRTSQQTASAFLQLIRWRYRFLIPPAEMLKFFAVQHITHPPGKELREIANYLHDCMRDAGLPLEQASDNPTSALANWICLNWIGTLIKFICLLWKDQTITSDSAQAFTEWSIQHMLPSPPRILGATGGNFINDLPRYILTQILLQMVHIKDTERGRYALQVISDVLGLSKDQYLRIISGVVDEI